MSPTPVLCSVQGCPNTTNRLGGAKGLCPLHYQRMRRNGTTDQRRINSAPESITCRLLAGQRALLVDIAGREGRALSDVLREAVALYLSMH